MPEVSVAPRDAIQDLSKVIGLLLNTEDRKKYVMELGPNGPPVSHVKF
jgi:hypothetical protein